MQYLYEIRNKINNKRYIGRTNNIKARWNRHRNELRNNKHHCIYLQRAWNKYGEENFEFSIIDTRETLEEIQELESSYINVLDNTKLYNVSKMSSGGDLISYHPNRNEIVERITEGVRNRWENITEEEYGEYCNKYIGENNPNYKHGYYSQEEKRKRSEEWNNKTYEEKYCGRIPWNKGMKFDNCPPKSEETKRKISESNKGKHGVKIVCENVLFESLDDASELYGITSEGIMVRLKSNTEKFKEFFYYDESLHGNCNFEKYDKQNIDYFRKKSYVYNHRTKERKVFCEGKIFNSIKEAKDFYNFSSNNAIDYRCKSEKWKEFYYIDDEYNCKEGDIND